jgi:hypothetical protein
MSESVLLQYMNDAGQTRTAVGIVDATGQRVTWTGIPPGLRSFTVVFSCSAGQQDGGSFAVTVP